MVRLDALQTDHALATRTLPWGRVHIHAAYAPGESFAPTDAGAGSSRWFAGFVADRAFALRQTLGEFDVTAEESLLDDDEYRRQTQEILGRPPRPPVVEDAIDPRDGRLAPEAKAMFERAHSFHRPV